MKPSFVKNIPMANTNYDQITSVPIQTSAQDKMETHSTSGVSVTSSVRRTTKYKKYGLKDYQQTKEVVSKNRMGGLGANIGGE